MATKTCWRALNTVLITSTLFNMTACNFHYVRSIENQNITSCPHDQQCNTFHNNLMNATKYFSSNAQFNLQQGSHYLYSDVMISNVHNFSIIGGDKLDTVGTQYSLIVCSSSTGIIMINSSSILLSNLKILNCALDVAAHTKLPNLQMMWFEEAQTIATTLILIISCLYTKLV